METKNKAGLVDGLVGGIALPYILFAFFKSGAWGNLQKRAGSAWLDIRESFFALRRVYVRHAGRWLQFVCALTAITFLTVASVLVAIWDRRVDGFVAYELTFVTAAVVSAIAIVYGVFLQGAIPEYERDPVTRRRIWDERTKYFKLSSAKEHAFGRINAIGFMIVAIFVSLIMAAEFVVLGYLRHSSGFTLLAIPFFLVGAVLAASVERVGKFVTFQSKHIIEVASTETIDFASVALIEKTMGDFWRNFTRRNAEGRGASPSNSAVIGWISGFIFMAILTQVLFIEDEYLSPFVKYSHMGWLLVFPGVNMVGILWGKKAVVMEQGDIWVPRIIRYYTGMIVVVKIATAKWYYAGYACGLLIPPSEGWKVGVLAVTLVGLAIFLFLVGSKAIKEMRKFTYVMWTAATICFVLGIGTFISALADGGAATQACYDNTKARASGQVVDPLLVEGKKLLGDLKQVSGDRAEGKPTVVAPTATAAASASVSTPPPAKDEATKLAEAVVNEIKQARTDMQKEIDDTKQLVAVLRQVKTDRGESDPLVKPLSSGRTAAKTSSAPTSSAKSSSASTVAIADSDAEVEAARKRLAAKYLQ